MADIYGSHFEFGGVASSTYGLMFSTVEESRMIKAAGTIGGVTIFNKKTKSNFLIDDDYESFPVSYEVEIITDDESVLTLQDRRSIEKWLFNRSEYRKLYLSLADDCYDETSETIDGNVKRLYMNCRFINPERLEYNGGIVGYKATLEADSGLWWQDPVTKSFALSNTSAGSTSTVSVSVDTDIDDYTYPKVVITVGSSGGDVIISNNTDDSTRLTKFVGAPANATITINGKTNYVSGDYYEILSDKNFPRLLDGTNNITVRGNVSNISFEFNNRRML